MVFGLNRVDVSNVELRACWSKERFRNLPQRSWCKDKIIRIIYYLVQRVFNHRKVMETTECRLPCDGNGDR